MFIVWCVAVEGVRQPMLLNMLIDSTTLCSFFSLT